MNANLTYEKNNNNMFEMKSHRVNNNAKNSDYLNFNNMMAEPVEIPDDDTTLNTPVRTLVFNEEARKPDAPKIWNTEYRFYNPINSSASKDKHKSQTEKSNEVYYYDPAKNNKSQNEYKNNRFIEWSQKFSNSLNNNASNSPFRRNHELSEEITNSFWDYLYKRNKLEKSGSEVVIKNTLPTTKKSPTKPKWSSPAKRTSLKSSAVADITKPVLAKYTEKSKSKPKKVAKNTVKCIPKNRIYSDDINFNMKQKESAVGYVLTLFC